MMDSLRTRRFLSFALALAAVLLLGLLALYLAADTALVAVVLGHVVTLASVYVGAGAWHDTRVRQALAPTVQAPLTVPPESPGGAT